MRAVILTLAFVASACAEDSDYQEKIAQALEHEYGVPIPHAQLEPEIDAVEHAVNLHGEPARSIDKVRIYQIEDIETHCWGHRGCAFGRNDGTGVILIPTAAKPVGPDCVPEQVCGKSVTWILTHELIHAMMTEPTGGHENGFWDVAQTVVETLGLEGIGPEEGA